MTVRSQWLAASLGLALGAGAVSAGEPAPLPLTPGAILPEVSASTNQQMADRIANQLRQSAQLRHYSVDVQFAAGTAELSGIVEDQPQREEVIRLVQGLPGVQRVRDRLSVRNPGQLVRTVQAGAPVSPPLPILPPPKVEGPPQGGLPEPAPVFQAGPTGPNDLNPPRMPPYAWPTYAPYNNYSRVASPGAYPYNAWPFIGPCYPFPKVPPGWRSVKLEWDDGYWWYSRTGTKYDWWKVRYF